MKVRDFHLRTVYDVKPGKDFTVLSRSVTIARMKKHSPSTFGSQLRPLPLRELPQSPQELKAASRSGGKQSQQKSFFSSLLLGIAISCASLLLAALLIEFGYRLVLAFHKPAEMWSDRPKTYYLPETAETLQDFSYSKTKPSGMFRIAVIGDSFTFAPHMQFDDAFPKRLERFFNLATPKGNAEQSDLFPKGVQVINFGVPGYSTHHEVLEVKRALKYEPDLILLQITLNDVQEKPYQPTGLRRQHDFGEFQSSAPILSYWKSLEFVLRRLHNEQTHHRYQRYYYDLFENEKNWRSFHSGIASIARRAKKKNVPITAVVFPLFGLPLDASYPFMPLHQKTTDTLKKFGIPTLDLFSTFEGIPIERIQLIPNQDFHPNEIGHRMAAEAIYHWLKHEGYVPEVLFTHTTHQQRTDIYGKAAPQADSHR